MTIDENQFTEELLDMIRDRRQELGITKTALASMIGRETSGRQWIAKIESGNRRELPIQTIFIIMKALRINIIFEREDVDVYH